MTSDLLYGSGFVERVIELAMKETTYLPDEFEMMVSVFEVNDLEVRDLLILEG